VNKFAGMVTKYVFPDGCQCDHCNNYFDKLTLIFTNGIGFKDLCVKCKERKERFYNKSVAKFKFPSKKEFISYKRING